MASEQAAPPDGGGAGRAQVADVSFGDVGGLDHYIRALKEMVFLPLARPCALP